MPKTRIAVVGAGLIGAAHIGVLQSSRSCVLAAIADPSPAAASLARDAGVQCFDSLDELLARARPDGVVLATPNVLHVEQALKCAAAGVAVLVEKPVATSVREGEKLLAAPTGSVLVGHHRAHSPIMSKAREVVSCGALGRIVAVAGSATFLKPDEYFERGAWRRQPGGGPVLINMIHEVHNLRMLCGEIVAVQAIASSAVRGFPVEDTAVIGLRFAGGALGSFLLSDTAASARSWELTSGENPAYPHNDDEDCYVISGTRGSLAMPSMRLKTYREPSWWKPFDVRKVDIAPADPLARQMEHFGAVVRGEAEPLVTVHDGVANLRVIEAITAAAKSGSTVDLG